MMFNFYPWGLSINIIRPMGVSKTKVSFLSYILDESKLRQGAGADLHKVELEDEDVVQNVPERNSLTILYSWPLLSNARTGHSSFSQADC